MEAAHDAHGSYFGATGPGSKGGLVTVKLEIAWLRRAYEGA